MPDIVNIAVHSSQFPQEVTRVLLESLRTRQVNHKFHYESVKQIQKWLAVHRAYSPWRTDADCPAIYERAYQQSVTRLAGSQRVQVVGLGCGDGTKDARLLGLLKHQGKEVFYTPVDVSAGMVLLARQTALPKVAAENCFPTVCDLAVVDDLGQLLQTTNALPERTLLGTCFGMLPNFEPDIILPRLSQLLRPGSLLLLSANLAPGPDYAAGVDHILPLYDNEATRDWLLTFLYDLGIDKGDGELRFMIEDGQQGLKRVAAYYGFNKPRRVRVEDQAFDFAAGDSIRLFFSYRHTPSLLRSALQGHQLRIVEQWLTESQEEGVFLIAT